MQKVTERFLSYIKTDTTSVDDAESYPSSPSQLDLGRQLAAELEALGLQDVEQDAHGYVTATVPATVSGAPVIGLISHLDTSNAVAGGPIHPQFVDYEGGSLVLNREAGIVMTPEAFPDLAALKLGYRSGYIKASAERYLREGCPECREELLAFHGIGPKVANCIMLFGLRDTAAFPIDTWVKQIMNDMYGFDLKDTKGMQAFAAEKYGDLAGYAQQYLFYYYRDRSRS